MKRICHLFFMVFVGIYLASLVGCSKDDTGGAADSVLVLSADKQGIIADGRDTVHLSVTNEQNANITPQCQFVINGIKQDKAFFVTTKAGSFDIIAEYSSVYSNKVTVGAELPDIASFKLEGDKTKLFPDGADWFV